MKNLRNLTHEEIEWIIKNIKKEFPIAGCQDLKEQFLHSNIENIKEQLIRAKIIDDPSCIQKLNAKIIQKIRNSICPPGESVGITCAQSIGERQTQLCIYYEQEIIYIDKNKKWCSESIGTWIEDIFSKQQKKNIYDLVSEEGNIIGQVCPTSGLGISTIMADEKGMVHFIPIIEVSRHVMDKDNNDLLIIQTLSGRKTITTFSHSHLKWDEMNNELIPIQGKDLKIGDYLPVLSKIPFLSFIENQSPQQNLNKDILKKMEMLCIKNGELIDFLMDFFSYSPRQIKKLSQHFEKKVKKNKLILCRTRKIAELLSLLYSHIQIICYFIPAHHNKWFVCVYGKDGKQDKNGKQDKIRNEKKNLAWDRIISIQSFKDEKYSYVYNISVEGNQTFLLRNGIIVHNTLNSFHQSGISVATVITGVPRFLELLNTTKEPKYSVTSFELKEDFHSIRDIKNFIGDRLIECKFLDLVQDHQSIRHKEKEVWYDSFTLLYATKFFSKACISVQLNHRKLFEYRIHIKKIADVLEQQHHDVSCVFSPLSIAKLDIFIDISNVDISSLSYLPYQITEQNYIELYLDEIIFPKLSCTLLSGIIGINNFQVCKQPENPQKWMISTSGSNFLDIISLPFINVHSVRTNHAYQVYRAVGIEAVRQFLIDEFISVVSSDGSFVDSCHIFLLADIMTHGGILNPISRFGIKTENNSVLSRSSFEECLEHFCNAAFFSEKETLSSVSSSIMCGKRPNIGTGLCSLHVDLSQLS